MRNVVTMPTSERVSGRKSNRIRRVSWSDVLIISLSPWISALASLTSRSIKSTADFRAQHQVGERLGRAVMDLPRNSQSFIFLGLDERQRAGRVEHLGRTKHSGKPASSGLRRICRRNGLDPEEVDQETELLQIVLDVLVPVLELLGLGSHHEQAKLNLVSGVVEIANVLATVVVEMHLHIAHAIGHLQLAIRQLLNFAVCLGEQQRDFAQ